MHTLLSLYRGRVSAAEPGKTVLTVVDSRLQANDLNMAALDEYVTRAAGCLRTLGCEKGNRVLISLKGSLQVFAFFWGAVKCGAVPCVLFPGLGAGGLTVRLNAADADFFVTDADPAKLTGAVSFPPCLKKVILLGKPSDAPLFCSWDPAGRYEPAEDADVTEGDPAFIVFTSGTTGTPKPVVHNHSIADAILRSMWEILHACEEDVFWCTAHPAWITGTVYGLIGPLLCGIRSIQYDGSFHAKRWLPILQDRNVSLWYTAPTALRALMKETPEFYAGFDLSALKQIYSIGEPLPAKVYSWGEETFGQPIYDTWFQTETGTIRIANQPGQPILPGWMGKPVDDTRLIGLAPGQTGKLCLAAPFSSMFREYYRMPDAAAEKVSKGTFVTGDLVSVNAEGYLHYEGREDDVINTSGHLVGPLEVEQVLTADPSVAEAAVVSEPDELSYEVPAAFLVLADGCEWKRELEMALRVAVNNGVSVYAVPKHFHIVSELPHTMSGKINRAELRSRLISAS